MLNSTMILLPILFPASIPALTIPREGKSAHEERECEKQEHGRWHYATPFCYIPAIPLQSGEVRAKTGEPETALQQGEAL
jgi:hypothetical protein